MTAGEDGSFACTLDLMWVSRTLRTSRVPGLTAELDGENLTFRARSLGGSPAAHRLPLTILGDHPMPAITRAIRALEIRVNALNQGEKLREKN